MTYARTYDIFYVRATEVIKLSPRTGRPTSDKKTERLEIRMTPDESRRLKDCAQKLGVTKTDVLNMGLSLVEAELGKKKK